tara:strand:- start:591 stop:3617 length:3027 start_codon:yes stop_codon:yes gene_type:complete
MGFDVSKRIYGGPINPKVFSKLMLRQLLSSPEHATYLVHGNNTSVAPEKLMKSIGSDPGLFEGKMDLSSRTPWVRLWCAIEQYEINPPEGKDEKGAPLPATKGKQLNTKIYQIGNHIFNDYDPLGSTTEAQDESNVSGLAQQFLPDELTDNTFMKPGPGITSISVENTGRIMGSLRKAQVKFTVFNQKDFEDIYLRYFLKPGALMILDYGWNNADIDGYNPAELVKENQGAFEEKIFGNNGILENANGDMECVVGVVTKYTSNLRADGGYDCSIEMTSKNFLLLEEDVGGPSGISTKFTNKLSTWALLTVAADADDEIWNYDWINTKSADDIAYLYGIEDYAGDTYQMIAGRKVPLSIPPAAALRDGVYLQRLDASETKPELKENVFITFRFLERMLLNPLLGTKDIGMVRDKSNDDTFKFDQSFNSELAVTGLNPDLWKMMQVMHHKGSIKFLYGYPPGSPNPADDSGKLIFLYDCFINTSVVIEAFNRYTSADDIVKYIMGEVNASSVNHMELRMSAGNLQHTEISIVDSNHIPRGYKLIDLEGDTEERNLDQSSLFPFVVHSPNSIVQDLNLNFNVGSGKMASMVAIANDMHNRKFPFNKRMKDAMKLSNVLNQEQLDVDFGYGYLPATNKLPGIVETEEVTEDKLYNYQDEIPSALMNLSPQPDSKHAEYKESLDMSMVFATDKITNEDFDKAAALEKEFGEIEKEEKDFSTKLTEEAEESDWESQESSPGLKVAKNLIQYYEFQIRKNQDNYDINPSYNPPIMGIELSFSIYGIGGLSIGDAFRISYIPKEYRSVMHFIVKNLSQEIGPNGWKTKIKAQLVPDYGQPEKTKIDTSEMVIVVSKQYLKSLGYSHEQIQDYGPGGAYENDIEGFLTLTPENFVGKEDGLGSDGLSGGAEKTQKEANEETNVWANVDPDLKAEYDRVNKEMTENENNATIDEFNKSMENEHGQTAGYVKMGEATELSKSDCETQAEAAGYGGCKEMLDDFYEKNGIVMYKVQGVNT